MITMYDFCFDMTLKVMHIFIEENRYGNILPNESSRQTFFL